jgi:hypothetical protein
MADDRRNDSGSFCCGIMEFWIHLRCQIPDCAEKIKGHGRRRKLKLVIPELGTKTVAFAWCEKCQERPIREVLCVIYKHIGVPQHELIEAAEQTVKENPFTEY